MRVIAEQDLGRFLARVGDWLDRDPVGNNVMNTLLHGRDPRPELLLRVEDDDGPVGVAIRTAWRPMLISAMPPDAAAALARHIADELPEVRIVIGQSQMIGDFAGQIARRRAGRARELRGSGWFVLERVMPPAGVDGTPRLAEAADRELLIEWTAGFLSDVADEGDPESMADERIGRGQTHLWTVDGEPVTMASWTAEVAGVVRINLVYTPMPARRRGYASALTAFLAQGILDAGHIPMLFTDLANPTSNKIYQEIGFRKVGEGQMWEIEC